jgi:hypothetical protein
MPRLEYYWAIELAHVINHEAEEEAERGKEQEAESTL